MNDLPRNAKKLALRAANGILQECRQAIRNGEGVGIMYSSRRPTQFEWIGIAFCRERNGGFSQSLQTFSIEELLDSGLPSARDVLGILRKTAK